jgi:hypothetical protein
VARNVAGIAAAETNNDLGIAGVAWNCDILPGKIIAASGEGDYGALILALYWAVDQGADVINLSLGGDQPDDDLLSALRYAYEQGQPAWRLTAADLTRRPTMAAAVATGLQRSGRSQWPEWTWFRGCLSLTDLGHSAARLLRLRQRHHGHVPDWPRREPLPWLTAGESAHFAGTPPTT